MRRVASRRRHRSDRPLFRRTLTPANPDVRTPIHMLEHCSIEEHGTRLSRASQRTSRRRPAVRTAAGADPAHHPQRRARAVRRAALGRDPMQGKGRGAGTADVVMAGVVAEGGPVQSPWVGPRSAAQQEGCGGGAEPFLVLVVGPVRVAAQAVADLVGPQGGGDVRGAAGLVGRVVPVTTNPPGSIARARPARAARSSARSSPSALGPPGAPTPTSEPSSGASTAGSARRAGIKPLPPQHTP